MKKILALCMVAMLSVGLFAGCGSSNDDKPASTDENQQQGTTDNTDDDTDADDSQDTTDDSESNGQKVLKLVEKSDIPSLNSSIATDQVSFLVLGNIVEGLYTTDENHVPVPGVATDYQLSEDGKTYTFNLRQDSVWTNGDPVTAHDFVYAIRRLGDPNTKSQYQAMVKFAGLKNYAGVMDGSLSPEELGVKAEDDYTLVFELEFPVPYFISLMCFQSFCPLNQTYVEAQGEAFGTTHDTTLYNGPYVLEDWEKEYGWKFVKNDTYWDKDNVDIDIVEYRVVKEYNTRLNMYLNNEIDRVALRGEDVTTYKDDPNVSRNLEASMFYLELNQAANIILTNQKARKAMALVIDKSYIENTVLNDGSVAADYLVPKGLATSPIDGSDFREDAFDYNELDVETGKQLWAEAKEELGLDSYEMEILTTDTDTAKKLTEYVTSQLEDNLEGLDIIINQQPWKNKLDLVDNKDFEVAFSGWGPDYLDPTTFLELFYSESGHNRSSYKSSDYDKIIEDSMIGELTNKVDERWEALLEGERILLEEDAALIPIYQRGRTRLTQPYVKNMNFHLIGCDYTFKFVTYEK